MNQSNQASALSGQVGGSHYKELAIQPAVFCRKNNIPALEADAIAYIVRHAKKNGRQDLEKAIHCLQLVIAMDYSESAT